MLVYDPAQEGIRCHHSQPGFVRSVTTELGVEGFESPTQQSRDFVILLKPASKLVKLQIVRLGPPCLQPNHRAREGSMGSQLSAQTGSRTSWP